MVGLTGSFRSAIFHSRTRRFCALSLAMSFLLSLGGGVYAVSPDSVVQVRGGGDAPGSGHHARREAIANACNGMLVKHLEFWSDSSQLSRIAPILERGSNYFRNIRVIEHETEGEITHVEVEADLLLSRLREEIVDVMLREMDERPKAIVIVQDDFGDEPVRTMKKPGIAEKHIRKMLWLSGFEIVDSDRLREALSAEQLVSCVGGADALAAEAARALFADVAIVGRASMSVVDEKNRSNLVPHRGSVALRIVRAEDDSIAEELHATGIVESKSLAEGGPWAIEDACEKLKSSIASAMVMAKLFAPSDGGVNLALTGEPIDRTRDEFAAWLAVQDRVDGVEIVNDDGRILRLRLDYTGTVSDLVELLEERAAMQVTRVLDRNVTAAFPSQGGDFDQ